MNAVEYFNEKARMVQAERTGICTIGCANCRLSSENNDFNLDCDDFERIYPDRAVEIVQKWADEHPKKTNLDALREVFPDAINGFCPREVEGSPVCAYPDILSCSECKEKFWNSEYKEKQ